jgi:outer membrane receptor for ferrienterochelin and colicins
LSVNRNLFISIGIVLLQFAIAFSSSISGAIRDSQTREPLPGATVAIDKTAIGAAANSDGYFTIGNVTSEMLPVSLKIHIIGYKDKVIELAQFPRKDLEIFLEQTSWKMEDMVVTATRRKYMLKVVPVTTELITADDFKKSGALTVDNALDSHIGIDISDDLSGRGISLRGVDPSRVLVLVDGNRVIGRVRGSLDLGQIPLSNVKQIEIVKGTGSTLYGSEAMGGVVNIITGDPAKKSDLTLGSQYGSFNSYDFGGGLNSFVGGFPSALNIKYEHTDGFDLDKSTENTEGLENINRFNIDNKTIFRLSQDWKIDANIGFMAERKIWIEQLIAQGSGGSDTTYNFDDYEHNYRYDLALNSKWKLEDSAELSVGAHGSYYDHKWEKFTRTDYLSDLSKSIDDIGELSLAYNRKLGKGHTFTFGGDWVTERLKSAQLAVGDKRIYHGDLYTQYEWQPRKSLILMPGIRWENHQTYGNHYNPSFNLMWNPNSLFTLRGSVGRGFRAPSIKELYFEFDHRAAGYIVYGGGDTLDPETSINYSITAEINYKRRAMHRVSYFRNDLKHLIDFDSGYFGDPNYPLGIYHYVNVLKARTEGLEWETEIKVIDPWDLSFSYTYLIPRNLIDNIDLINRPRHTLKFSTTYELKRWDAGINFWGNWHSRKLWTLRVDTPDRESDLYAPARMTLSASVTKKLMTNFDLLAKVDNLTDNVNANYFYWPERNYSISLKYTIGRSN